MKIGDIETFSLGHLSTFGCNLVSIEVIEKPDFVDFDSNNFEVNAHPEAYNDSTLINKVKIKYSYTTGV
jgi:hypothetical protein